DADAGAILDGHPPEAEQREVDARDDRVEGVDVYDGGWYRRKVRKARMNRPAPRCATPAVGAGGAQLSRETGGAVSRNRIRWGSPASAGSPIRASAVRDALPAAQPIAAPTRPAMAIRAHGVGDRRPARA